MNDETWADIDWVSGIPTECYQVSSHGRVRSLPRSITRSNGVSQSFQKRILRTRRDRSGYELVCLRYMNHKSTVKVHRLVAAAFVDGQSEHSNTVNHINGIKGDNHASNLEWASHAGNMRHASENGLVSRGESHYRTSINNLQARVIYRLSKLGSMKIREIASVFGVDRRVVSSIGRRETWAHLHDTGGDE